MRCPSCNKFPSYDDPEVEVNDASVDDSGSITVEGRMVLKSACCGDELKEWSWSLEGQVEHEADASDKSIHELEVECDDAEGGDYYDNPGRPMRYRRHIYTVDATAKVKCSCGWSADVEMRDECRVSGFDELV